MTDKEQKSNNVGNPAAHSCSLIKQRSTRVKKQLKSKVVPMVTGALEVITLKLVELLQQILVTNGKWSVFI